MKFYAVTQKGIKKLKNEDRIIIGNSIISNGTFCTELDSGIVAVADGVGGNNAGMVASHFLASKLSAVEDVSIEQFSSFNDDLLKLSEEKSEFSNMATTLSGVLIENSQTKIFNIGNSRVYTLQSGKYLKQLTDDDTTLNFLISSGQLSLEDAENFERKNEITACFGGGNKKLFKIKMWCIDKVISTFVITTDGIHDYLDIDDVEDIINEDGLSIKACKKLIDMAREKGSLDDASVIFGGVL